MSVSGHQPPPFFNRGPAPTVRLVFFVALSLAMMVVDARLGYLDWLRQAVSALSYPLQQAAYVPVSLYREAGDYFVTSRAMQEETLRVKKKQLEVANALLRQEQLDRENQQLRALLDMKQRQTVPGVVAEILYNVRDPFSRKIIISKGSGQNVKAGQAVVDDSGVIGQVTRVFPLQAEVTLITHKEQAVPVQIARNGLRSVVFGSGDGQLELRFLAGNADVQEGDLLETSGLDGIYVPGLPVARVSRIQKDAAYSFARILCEPVAGVERHGMVLVLGTPDMLPPPPVEDEPKAKQKGKKGKK